MVLTNHIARLAAVTALLTALCLSASALGATPTAAQIEQFKRLSPSEQKALAQSMGVDIGQLEALAGGNGASSELVPSEEVSGPRVRAAENSDETQRPPTAKRDDIADEKQPLEPFGYSLFKLGPDAFNPASDIPVPANYILGPGDTVVIQLYGKESNTYTLELSREGNLQFPEIGPITLAGLNFNQARQKIENVVSEQMIGIKASITMGKLRSIRVFALGEVDVPGSYVVGSLSTMTNAIFSSGGITKIGSLRNIQLKRNGKTVARLDLYDLLLRGDTSGDARLLPGDVIFVPPVSKTASITGAVKRPAIYELKNEKTAKQLVELAGGLTASAYIEASKIERISDSGEKVLVELSQDSVDRQFINAGDQLIIGDSLDQVTDSITLVGHVKRPESIAWKPGMTFTDAVYDVNALLPMPDIDLALIERESPETREIQVLTLSPKSAFARPKSQADIALRARDSIHLFGFEDDRTELLSELNDKLKLQSNIDRRQQIVRIDGSVRFPGDYPLASNMTPTNLVQLAGGFTESALGRDGEITRYQINDARERVVIRAQVDFSNQNQPALLPGDTLRVKQIPLWTEKESVQLIGEVMHPGSYPLLPGETLIDVIKRAGGLTARAYPHGAIFSRTGLRELEQARLEELKKEVEADIAASRLETSDTRDGIDSDQAAEILENIEKTESVGRLVIDLPAILNAPDKFDFQLAEGDKLEIPRYKPSVTVVGEVQYPTSHFYKDKLSVGDYLGKSGGLKRNADKNRIYVIRANGEVFQPKGNGWFGSKRSRLNPGDTIVVPLDTKRVDKLTLWASITRIMYEAALGVAAIRSL